MPQIKHVLESQQFDPDLLGQIFRVAKHLKEGIHDATKPPYGIGCLCGRSLFTIFYEPSTRTRMSFAIAGQRLGMNVIWTENATEFSSAVKGETLEDTIRVLCEYAPDAIVLRHNETGAAKRAAYVSSVPIINAGDGKGQHPTQALLDLFTIQEKLGTTDGINVVMVGDMLNGRTVRSLVYLLAKYGRVCFTFVSPQNLRMGSDITDWLKPRKIDFLETDTLFPDILKHAHVVYCTRIQKERGSDVSGETLSRFRIGREQMEMMGQRTILMHPLPRVDEITTEVDSDPRAVYFEQAGNGMYIRMALLLWVLNKI